MSGVTKEQATVYRYDGRRYLSARAAYRKEARDILRDATWHVWREVDSDSFESRECECDACGEDAPWMLDMIYRALRYSAPPAGGAGAG